MQHTTIVKKYLS